MSIQDRAMAVGMFEADNDVNNMLNDCISYLIWNDATENKIYCKFGFLSRSGSLDTSIVGYQWCMYSRCSFDGPEVLAAVPTKTKNTSSISAHAR